MTDIDYQTSTEEHISIVTSSSEELQVEEMTEEVKMLQEVEDWMKKLQEIDKKKDKLTRMMGRRNSLDKLSPFLISNSEEEAVQNGNLVLKSDHLKQLTGERPNARELQKKEPVNNNNNNNNPTVKYNKVNKLGGLLGRRHSIGEYGDMLDFDNPDEALHNAMKLRRMEKLKKMAGV